MITVFFAMLLAYIFGIHMGKLYAYKYLKYEIEMLGKFFIGKDVYIATKESKEVKDIEEKEDV